MRYNPGGGRVVPPSSSLVRLSPPVLLRKALNWEYAEIDDLPPTDSMTVGEENEEIVETETGR